MIPFENFTWQAAVAGRWAARITGTLMVLFVLAFLIGEGPPSLARMTRRELLFSVGMASLFLGLIVAWFWEGWGGLLSVAGWVYLGVLAGRPFWTFPFAIPAAAGVMHLVCWWRLRRPSPPPVAVDPATLVRIRLLWISLCGLAGIFVLLCANEMLGQPPLMTPSGPPPAAVVGTWTAVDNAQPIVLTIGPDGAVRGTVGGAEVVAGRFLRNRSWFGRAINWRTDYMIRGRLSKQVELRPGATGDRFSAPVNLPGGELRGSLFLSHPGPAKPVGLHLEKTGTGSPVP